MENLPYDAILGGDFLRRNKALIDLERSRITFKQLGNRPSRTSEKIEPAHVMGTFLLQTTKYKDKKTSSKIDPKPLPQISDSSSRFRSQKKKEIGQIGVKSDHFSVASRASLSTYCIVHTRASNQQACCPNDAQSMCSRRWRY